MRCQHHHHQQQDTTRKNKMKKSIHQIETHPHREALKADQQNQQYNPFSEEAKDMNHRIRNVEYFEMCEVSPKIQCPLCLTYCTEGIVYCRCGFCLEQTKKRWQTNSRFDTLSIPNHVIHKGVFRGRRCGVSDSKNNCVDRGTVHREV